MDLIEIKIMVPSIIIDIRYATKNNFSGKILYDEDRCFLRKKTAMKLSKIQDELEGQALGLKIWDGYRPLSVQRELWKIIPNEQYVANPAVGSRHNRGAAVDLTLVNKKGNELRMPTDFDDFSEKAHYSYNDLPEEAIKNRELLREVMTKHGFIVNQFEWWHFDDEDWNNYKVLDVSFNEIGV